MPFRHSGKLLLINSLYKYLMNFNLSLRPFWAHFLSMSQSLARTFDNTLVHDIDHAGPIKPRLARRGGSVKRSRRPEILNYPYISRF